jgi:hypothetical protein
LGVLTQDYQPWSVKKITLAKSKEMNTGSNMAECSKEGYGSKKSRFTNNDDYY